MIIQELDIPFVPKHSGLPRSKAEDTGHLHLSDVIKFILKNLGKGYSDEENSMWDLDLAAEVGFMWEDVLGVTLADRQETHIRPGEILCEGIVGSPDGFGVDPKAEFSFADHEYKCTWRSTNKTPDMIDYWQMQFKGYCYMLGTPCCVVWIMHLNGDWKRTSKRPQIKVYRQVYTQLELQDNWGMIINNANYMKSKGIWRA